MNNKVTVTGMQVRAHVNNNLLISETNSESAFVTAITQSRDADLEPVSTIDGKAYKYILRMGTPDHNELTETGLSASPVKEAPSQ